MRLTALGPFDWVPEASKEVLREVATGIYAIWWDDCFELRLIASGLSCCSGETVAGVKY